MTKPSPGTARILIATDNADDATQIQRQLKNDFVHLRATTVAERGVQDFDDCKPDVLVLAFDRLDKAQSYYLGLYRTGQSLLQHPHRTVILCSKDEVREAFELCKKEYFDDYVLYWPHTHDGPRLAMSIWSACREMMALRPSDTPGPAQLLAHARHLADLDRTLGRELAAAAALEPVSAWAQKLQNEIEPALAGIRAMTEQVRKIRLVVMVVEDDELIQQLVLRTLDPALYEVLPVGDGAAALSLLRRVRPDVILMDISLPGMDGVALTQRLKAARHLADIPVVMMTGDARRETLISSMEGGAAAFVVKPFTRESLTAKLEKLLPR